MKATGIVRKVDNLGRLVIPSELREAYGIDPESPVEIYSEDDRIVIKKYEPSIPDEISIKDITTGYRGKPVYVVPQTVIRTIGRRPVCSQWMLVDNEIDYLVGNETELDFADISGDYKLYPKEW